MKIFFLFFLSFAVIQTSLGWEKNYCPTIQQIVRYKLIGAVIDNPKAYEFHHAQIVILNEYLGRVACIYEKKHTNILVFYLPQAHATLNGEIAHRKNWVGATIGERLEFMCEAKHHEVNECEFLSRPL